MTFTEVQASQHAMPVGICDENPVPLQVLSDQWPVAGTVWLLTTCH